MPARSPEEIHPLFGQAFSAGDLDGLMALYEPTAKLFPQPDHSPVTGAAAIREALQGFLALKPTFTLETMTAVQAGDIALLRSRWKLSGKAPDGTQVEMAHRGVEIARRQANGSWLLVIDHPFGAD